MALLTLIISKDWRLGVSACCAPARLTAMISKVRGYKLAPSWTVAVDELSFLLEVLIRLQVRESHISQSWLLLNPFGPASGVWSSA